MRRLLGLVGAALLLAALPVSAAWPEPVADDVVIALDLSGSMTTERLRPAVAAAAQFISQLPEPIRCGLVTFSSEARLVVPPTTDRAPVLAALADARAGGKTALFDAIATSLAAVRDSAKSHVILLSDGRDTVSGMSLQGLLSAIGAQDTTVSIIAIDPEPAQVRVLERIVEAASGELILPAGVDEFIDSFIAALTPPSPTPTPTPTPEPEAVLQLPDWTPVALAALASLLVGSVLLTSRGALQEVAASRRRERMVSSYSEPPGESAEAATELPQLRSRLARGFAKTADRLDQAQVPLAVEHWLAIQALLFLAALGMLYGLTRSTPISLVFAAVLANRLPYAYLQRRVNARLRQFESDLPVMLSVVSSSLRSGLTFAQALDTAVADDKGEIGRQMRRALTEMRVGATLDEALMRVAQRMGSEDLRWAVTALAIQREVGGSLSKILDTSAEAIRGRAELRREVRTLSAEGRLSAYVLLGLPVLIFAFLAISRPDYVSVFWSEPIGVAMLIAMLAAFAAGWAWLRRLVEIRV